MRRSQIPDIAKQAGVSTATVDRVLHNRMPVRAATAQRVLKAAADLNYLAQDDLWKALRPEPMDIAFLLPSGTNRYLNMLGDTIKNAADMLTPYHVNCRMHKFDSFDPIKVAATLRRWGKKSQAIAFMALDHPKVVDAVDELVDSGVYVISLISDLGQSKRSAYVGLDNRAAGRTAAELIGRFAGKGTGSVAMIAGSLAYRGHEERELGFMRLMQENYPQLRVVGVSEGQDDAETNYRLTKSLLTQFPDLVGLYNIGGGAEGVGQALKERSNKSSIQFVAHGLTPDTRALLIDGTLSAVINQTPQTVLLNAVRTCTNLRDNHQANTGIEPMRISIVIRENLP